MERVFNFAPGPSMLPLPVLEQIQKELLCYGSTGMSVMEMSHRSSMYLDIFNQTVADLREVMAIPDHYKVIFPQGGATAMFAAVAMNLMDGGHADYVDSGNFAHNALVEASSTAVREKIRSDDSLDGILPDVVLRYIKEKRLYAPVQS